jgi:hypothetical protein
MLGGYRDHINDYQLLFHRITWQRIINPSNTEGNLNYIQRLKLYRAVNTYFFGYKNKPANVV